MRKNDWSSTWRSLISTWFGILFTNILLAFLEEVVAEQFTWTYYIPVVIMGSVCMTLLHNKLQIRPRRICFYPETSQRLFRCAVDQLLAPEIKAVTEAVDTFHRSETRTCRQVHLCENDRLLGLARSSSSSGASTLLECAFWTCPSPPAERATEPIKLQTELPWCSDPKELYEHQLSPDLTEAMRALDGDLWVSTTKGLFFGIYCTILNAIFSALNVPIVVPVIFEEEDRGPSGRPLKLPKTLDAEAGLLNEKVWEPDQREKIAVVVHFVEEIRVHLERMAAIANTHGVRLGYRVRVGIGRDQNVAGVGIMDANAELGEDAGPKVMWEQLWMDLWSEQETQTAEAEDNSMTKV